MMDDDVHIQLAPHVRCSKSCALTHRCRGMSLEHMAAYTMGNQAMPDGATPGIGGVSAGEGGNGHGRNGDLGDEVATSECVAGVGCVSKDEVAGPKADGYREGFHCGCELCYSG